MDTILYIVVPCYNEEKMLPISSKAFSDKLSSLICGGKVSEKSRILFVDDGSEDATWETVCRLHAENPVFTGVKLSHNQGEQTAVLAGLSVAVKFCDLAITIDADIQDDLDAVDQMIEAYAQGYDLVYGVRKSRATDTFMKRTTAGAFYKLSRMLGTGIVNNNGGFRLLSKRVIEALLQYKEVGLYLNGLLPMVGFKSTEVYYDRAERAAGETGYSYRKMFALALEGIVSFSSRPIYLIGILGLFLLLCSTVLGIVLIVKTCLHTASSWMWILFAVCFFGSLQLTAIGVIGAYIGKILTETKARPRFFIEQDLQSCS